MTNSHGCLVFVAAAVLAWVVGMPARAAQVSELFSAQVSVEDASDEAREAGIELALARVLVRVTGLVRPEERAELEPVLASAAALVQSYRYVRTEGEVLLSVTFDGQAVQEAVADAGMPVWGQERPQLLVWLAIDYGGGRRTVVAADSDSRPAGSLRSAAEDRGLPFALPLMDAQDRARISFADIWGGFREAVDDASERYAPDAILLGRARRLASGRMSVDWTLRFGAATSSGRGGLRHGIDMAADFFASQFAVREAGGLAGPVAVEVSGLGGVGDYAKALRHLERLSVVEHVRLSVLTGDAATFELHLRGTQEQLRRSLALGDVLEPLPSAPAQPLAGPVMRYRPVP